MRMMIEGDTILIDMPYNILLMDKIKQLDGKWDSKRELWRVDKSKYEDLVNINNKAEFHELMTRQQRMGVMKDLYTRKGYSSKTSKNYLGHIGRFLDFAEDCIELSDVNRYMVYLLEDKQCSHSYCNQAINAIKTYLRIFGVVNEEQLVKMDRPKKEQKLPKVLAKSEMKDMLTMTKNVKHKTAFMIAYSCGLRVSEVANLKVTDIDSKRMVITIHQSKGRKDRIIKLSTILLDQLREYYKIYKPKEWLFESQMKDGHISSRTLQKVFKEQAERAGIKKNATFHSIRHSYATHMLETGVDIRFIQEFLGHSDIKTTQIYLSVSTQSMANIPNPLDLL